VHLQFFDIIVGVGGFLFLSSVLCRFVILLYAALPIHALLVKSKVCWRSELVVSLFLLTLFLRGGIHGDLSPFFPSWLGTPYM